MFLDKGCSAHFFKDRELFISLEPCKATFSGIGSCVQATHKGMTRFGEAYLGNTEMNLLSPNQIYTDNKIRTEEDKFVTAYEASTNTYTLTGRHIGYIIFSSNTSKNIPCGTVRLTSTLNTEVACTAEQLSENVPAVKDILATNPRVTDRARKALHLHYALNHPSDANLKRTLMNGGIVNTSVTPNDLANARTLFGSCPGCEAGKATNHTTGGTYNTANRVAEHLHCDIVYVPTTNGKSALYHLSSDEYCTDIKAYPMADQLASTLHGTQMQLINHYRTHGHNPDTLYYDDGANIKATEAKLNAENIKLVQAPAQEHDKHAESAYRTVQSTMRCVLSSLPYKLPVTLLKYL